MLSTSIGSQEACSLMDWTVQRKGSKLAFSLMTLRMFASKVSSLFGQFSLRQKLSVPVKGSEYKAWLLVFSELSEGYFLHTMCWLPRMTPSFICLLKHLTQVMKSYKADFLCLISYHLSNCFSLQDIVDISQLLSFISPFSWYLWIYVFLIPTLSFW